MNNAAAAVADACDTAAPSPCGSGCGELPSPPALPSEPPAASQPAGPPSLLPGLELWGKAVKPQKKRGLYKTLGGGGCCSVPNGYGKVSPVGTVLLEARREAYRLPGLQSAKQLAPLAAHCAGRLVQVCVRSSAALYGLEMIPSLQLKERQSALEGN